MRIIVALFAILAAVQAGEVKLGKPLTLKQSVPVDQIIAQSASLEGKTVQVKGRVRAVCSRMGCWMDLVDVSEKNSILIKVDDGVIVFPKEATGKTAIAEGKLVKNTLTREQATARAKHFAEESGQKFDPSSVKSGQTIYQIQGTGAVILD
jgi:hypothetical protein